MPSLPTPGSTAAALPPAGAGLTPPAGKATTDFLAVLAGMTGAAPPLVAAPTVPGAPGATLAAQLPAVALPFAPPVSEQVSLADIQDDTELEAETDSSELTEEDPGVLAALGLPALPLPAPAAALPAIAPQTFALTAGEKPEPESPQLAASATNSDSAGPQLDFGAQLRADTVPEDARPLVPVLVGAPNADLADNIMAGVSSAEAAPVATNAASSSGPVAQLHAATAAAHAAQNAEAATPRDIRAPLGTHQWTQDLGSQLTWMAQHGQDAASLRLSPEHLGPLEIRISMKEGEASVWFGAANADTRAALDQSLPKLKEMFAAQGMVLADAGVFKEAPRQQNKASIPTHSRGMNEGGEPAAGARVNLSRLGLVDTYV